MPVFNDFGRVVTTLRTQYRRIQNGVMRTIVQVLADTETANSDALSQFTDTSYPAQTASGWILDAHWLPLMGLSRNGLSDAQARLFVLAKRRLNASTGNVDGLLVLLRELLPLATTIEWTAYYPKQWEVLIAGVPLSESGIVLEFLRKRPSPQGGGYSVAGDNGIGIAFDPVVMSFSSIHGPLVLTGSYSSIYGASPVTAGWAHQVPI